MHFHSFDSRDLLRRHSNKRINEWTRKALQLRTYRGLDPFMKEIKWNDWCCRPRFCTVRLYWGRGQPGGMRWLFLWSMIPLVQDRLLDLLTSSPTTVLRPLFQTTYMWINHKLCPNVNNCHLLFIVSGDIAMKYKEFEICIAAEWQILKNYDVC